MTRPPRLRASLSPEQGIHAIQEHIRTIDSTPDLRKSDFGVDVRASLQSMRVRLLEGNFFSQPMEKAIEGWGRGISKWITPPEEGVH